MKLLFYVDASRKSLIEDLKSKVPDLREEEIESGKTMVLGNDRWVFQNLGLMAGALELYRRYRKEITEVYLWNPEDSRDYQTLLNEFIVASSVNDKVNRVKDLRYLYKRNTLHSPTDMTAANCAV
jgi:hypothetical protein